MSSFATSLLGSKTQSPFAAALGAAAPVGGAAPADDGGGGLFGFLGNAWEGLTGAAGGLASLLAASVHDDGRALASILPGRQDWGVIADNPNDSARFWGFEGIPAKALGINEEGFHPLDDSSILGSTWDRYEPFLPGGTPASEGFKNLYDDPVSYLLDAASVAGGAAKLASVGGAAKIAGATGELGDAARLAKATTMADLIAPEVGVAEKAARYASTRAGLEALGQGDSVMAKLLPKTGARLVEGEGMVPTTQAANPLYRAMGAPIRNKLLTEDLSALEARRSTLASELAAMPGDPRLVGDIDVLDSTIKSMEKAGLTRIERPQVAAFNARRVSGKVIADLRSKAFSARDRQMQRDVATTQRFVSEDPTIGTDGATFVQGVDIDLQGAASPVADWAVRQGLAGGQRVVSLGTRVEQAVPVPAGGGGVGVLDDIPFGDETPTGLNLDDPIVTRTETLVGKVREFIDNADANREEMTATGWDVDAEIDGARRMIRGLYDGLKRETPDAKTRWADEMRLNQVEDLADGFTAGGLTPRQALDRAYRPLRAKYGLDYNYDLEDFEGGPSLAEVDDALHAAGEVQPVYFPHIDATRLKSSDFFTSRQHMGANIYAKDPHNEQMRLTLLKRGTWLKDPIEVAKRRGARMVRETETFNMWTTMVRRFGKELADPKQVPHGYSLVSPDMLFVNHKTRTSLLNRIDENLTAGHDSDSAVAKALKDTLEENRNAVKELTSAGNVKYYAVPNTVLKQLDEAARWAPAFGGKSARLYWDTPMNLWRGLTLTASPRWVVNNVLGNIGFGIMQGVKVADVMRIGSEKFRVLAQNFARRHAGLPEVGPREKSLTAQVHRLEGTEDLGHGYIGTRGEQYNPKLGAEAENTAMGRAITAIGDTKAAGRLRSWGDVVKSVNTTIEDTFREASFLTAAEKAQGKMAITRTARSFTRAQKRVEDLMDKGFTEGSGKLALDEVNHFYGDYGAMSPFERHVVRRWLFPFYGFFRHSTKLLVTFPFEYPMRAQVLAGLDKINEDMLAEYGPMPEWMDGTLPIGAPGVADTFFSGRGANPFNGPAEGLTGIANSFNPLIKTVFEQATGRSMFTGREFSDKDVVTPYGSDQQYRITYDDAGNPIGAEPVDKVAPSILQTLLNTIPQVDMAKDLIAGGSTYDTASLLDALQQRAGDFGEASPMDPETGEPYSPVGLGSSLGKLAGFSTFHYDLPAYQERLAEEQLAALKEALRRAGGS